MLRSEGGAGERLTVDSIMINDLQLLFFFLMGRNKCTKSTNTLMGTGLQDRNLSFSVRRLSGFKVS